MLRAMHARASILVIGDEILDGHTRDTNSGWLAERLARAGVAVERIVTVGDDHDVIGEALEAELGRARPRLVFTSGGIGSTPDDLTMAAVAGYLGVRLVVHPHLDERIRARADEAAQEGAPVPPEQISALRRMAQVPDGAYLLEGRDGLTPGVAIDVDGGVESPAGATLVILPGVPQELTRIVEHGVDPVLERIGSPVHVREILHPYPESMLSPLLSVLTEEHPAVAIGSYPGRECVIRLKGPPEEVARVERRLGEHLDALAHDEVAGRLSARWQARWE